MARLSLILLLLVLPLSAIADTTEAQLKAFLQSRQVIDQVYFETASDQLTDSSRKKLDDLGPQLQQLNKDGFLFRVEGFASQEGDSTRNVNLSLARAMSVSSYIRDQHKLDFNVFLTGFVEERNPKASNDSRRVDIAVYVQLEAAAALFDNQGTVERMVIK